MTPEEQNLVDAAREYDRANRPRGNWQSVPPEQVLRLLTGARLAADTAFAEETRDVNATIRYWMNYIHEKYGPEKASA